MITFYHDSLWIIIHVQSLLLISTQVMSITCSISIIYASPFMSSPSVCLLSVRISVYAYFLFMLTVMCILYFMPIFLVYLLPVYSRFYLGVLAAHPCSYYPYAVHVPLL